MRALIITFSCLLIGYAAIAQHAGLVNVLKKASYPQLLSYLEKNKYIDRNKVLAGSGEYFEISPGYYRNYREFSQRKGNTSIDLIMHKSSIIAWRVVTRNYETANEVHDSLVNVAEYKKLEESFYSIYETRLNIDDVYRRSIFSRSNCGIAGGFTEKFLDIERLAQQNDIATLSEWLRSGNIYDQLYAIFGFELLKRQKIHPSKKDLALIKIISRKDGYVNSCSGCSPYSIGIQGAIEIAQKWLQQ